MSAQRRLTLVMTIALALTAGVWAAVVPGVVSVSSALWISLAIVLLAVVSAKFQRHAELPESVKLH